MKKIFVLLPVFTAMALAFAPNAAAQFTWQLDSELGTGVVAWNIPTGERAQQYITLNGVTVQNTGTDAGGNNPVNDRGDYTYNTGGLDVLTYGRRTWLRPNELRLSIDYTGQAVDFHVRTLLDPLVANVTTAPGGQHNTTGNHSLVMGDGRTPNWSDMLRFSFDEYYLRGTARFITGYLGNTPDRGKVAGFSEAFTDDVLKTIMVEYYGVNTPAANADFSVNGQDANNFRTRPSQEPGADDPYGWVMPYFMFGGRFRMRVGKSELPFTVQIAADPGNNSGVDGSLNYTRFNGSARVSIERIADWLTFDAIYRIRGGDPNKLTSFDQTNNPTGAVQPDGSGLAAHVFGLYANILKVPALGIGLGYSGYAVSYEDTKDRDTGIITATKGPLYSGIDLRLQYTGLKNITITSINNVSFATADHSTDNVTSVGVLGSQLDQFTADGWLALYNALGLDWKLGQNLTASFQIGNRYGLLTTDNAMLGGGVSTVKRGLMQLGGGAYVVFQWNRFISVKGGFAFRYLNDSYSNTDPASQNAAATRNASGGSFDIAIPIQLTFQF